MSVWSEKLRAFTIILPVHFIKRVVKRIGGVHLSGALFVLVCKITIPPPEYDK